LKAVIFRISAEGTSAKALLDMEIYC
jgi:hypothetical protein